MAHSHLKVLRNIARGGLADISLAIDARGEHCVVRKLHRHLALKLRPHWYFRRGMRVRRRLSPHPNIVGPIGHGYDGVCPYEIIEYVPGENLHEMIVHKRPELQDCALQILRQTALAISHVHNKGMLHLDVKAENVLVNYTDMEAGVIVKLTDFDMSRRYRTVNRKLRCGTASHMAPEQLCGGKVSFLNDIFAFGVMAYYMVTGKMPFHGFSVKELRHRQVSKSFHIAEPRKLNPDLTPKLNWLILRCLEKDTNHRFPNMAYLVQELGRL